MKDFFEMCAALLVLYSLALLGMVLSCAPLILIGWIVWVVCRMLT